MTIFRAAEAARFLGVSDDTVRELGLEPGTVATAVVKATTVIIERPHSKGAS